MPPRKAPVSPEDAPRVDPAVVAFLAALDHPRKADIEAVRALLLDASPTIREGVKWNAPSFRTTEFFATFHLRARDRVQLVFHRGAKAREAVPGGVPIPDPDGLVAWLGTDRCMVTLGSGAEIQARAPAFQAIVREWIRWV